jgi:hypothetical protein
MAGELALGLLAEPGGDGTRIAVGEDFAAARGECLGHVFASGTAAEDDRLPMRPADEAAVRGALRCGVHGDCLCRESGEDGAARRAERHLRDDTCHGAVDLAELAGHAEHLLNQVGRHGVA